MVEDVDVSLMPGDDGGCHGNELPVESHVECLEFRLQRCKGVVTPVFTVPMGLNSGAGVGRVLLPSACGGYAVKLLVRRVVSPLEAPRAPGPELGP